MEQKKFSVLRIAYLGKKVNLEVPLLTLTKKIKHELNFILEKRPYQYRIAGYDEATQFGRDTFRSSAKFVHDVWNALSRESYFYDDYADDKIMCAFGFALNDVICDLLGC